MADKKKHPDSLFITEEQQTELQTGQTDEQPAAQSEGNETPPTDTTPEPNALAEAQAFYDKYGPRAEQFERYNQALDLLTQPSVQQILNSPRLTGILLGMDVPQNGSGQQEQQTVDTKSPPPTISQIQIPEISDDDLADPTVKKLVGTLKSMRDVIAEQQNVITTVQTERQQNTQRQEAFNQQILLAAQMGAQNPEQFVRVINTREGQEWAAKLQIQAWNAQNTNAEPAPKAPPVNPKAQEAAARLEKEAKPPAPGAGGGSGGEGTTDGLFVLQDAGQAMFPV